MGFDIEPSTEIKMSNMFCVTYLQNQVDFLAGALALGEPLSVGQIVGAAVIVAGVYTANASAS